MDKIKEHLIALVDLFQLITTMSRLEDEDRYWKLYRIKDKINWIRKELGYDPIKFIKGTNTIILDDLIDKRKERKQEKEKT